MSEYLIEAWENWSDKNQHEFLRIYVSNYREAEIEGLEFAFTLLDPYMEDIKNYALYLAEHTGERYSQAFYNIMLECAHYEIWDCGIWEKSE